MSSDLVSICIPVYNGEKYLETSLISVQNQSYKNLDILIVDDQSTDAGLAIAQKFVDSDNRFRIIRNEKNLGLVGNWNRCIEEAKGQWVKLHFQDDLMSAEAIEKMHAFACERKVDLVLTDREYFFEGHVSRKKMKFYNRRLPRLSNFFEKSAVIQPQRTSDMLRKLRLNHNWIGEPIIGLMKKTVVSEIGYYDSDFKQICDFEFWLRLALSRPVGFIPENLHLFRVHSDSQSARNSKRKGINPSFIDRILLAHKIEHHSSFEGFRNSSRDGFTEDLLKHYVSRYANRYGTAEVQAEVGGDWIEAYRRPHLHERIKRFFNKD